jgi:transposase-like protein
MTMATKDTRKSAPTEVAEKATRRQFTNAYKLEVIREAEQCTELGSIEAMLRRRGLYSSHLTNWRQAEARGELNAPGMRKRGPAPTSIDARDREIEELKRQNAKLTARAERAEKLVEIQKKVAELLGTPLPDEKDGKR